MLCAQNRLDSDVLEGPPGPPVTVCISALEGTVEKSTDWHLPGSGAPAEGCGTQIPKFCKTHDSAFWGRSHCNERTCPRCYERWASKEAQRASRRIAWGAKYWEAELGKPILIGHFAVSMSSQQSLYVHDWSPEKAKKLVYEICQAHGVLGGVAIFHPWRRDDDSKEYVPDDYWHWHVVGLHSEKTTPGGSDIGPDGRKIVFKHIKDDEYQNYGGLRSQKAIQRVIQYQLTHAGLEEGTHAITYFGVLAYNKLPAEKVHSLYPDALEDDSKTNPEVLATCPICGSTEIEPCYELDFTQMPTLTVPTIYEPHDRELVKLQVHPEPEYEPSPEAVDEAEQILEHKFQNLYDNEPEPAHRHDLTKERQRARAKLAQMELGFFNLRNPLSAMWIWLQGVLEDGPQLLEDLDADQPAVLQAVIDLNLATKRLRLTPGGRLCLVHEYDLDDALRDLHDIVLNGEPIDGSDWRLERLIVANAPDGNPLLTDFGYVFGLGGRENET